MPLPVRTFTLFDDEGNEHTYKVTLHNNDAAMLLANKAIPFIKAMSGEGSLDFAPNTLLMLQKDILLFTWRDNIRLVNNKHAPEALSDAYAGNWGELRRALQEVLNVNGFLSFMPTIPAGETSDEGTSSDATEG